MNLADIEQMIADHGQQPGPFNGATRLVFAPGVLTAMQEALEVWARNPLMGRCPEIEVRAILPDGHGFGFRDWREGDDPEIKGLGPVMVWALMPKDK